jgi:hypothetical protein
MIYYIKKSPTAQLDKCLKQTSTHSYRLLELVDTRNKKAEDREFSEI